VLHERKSRLTEGRTVMSSPDGDLAPIRGGAPRVGGELRAARLQLGWDLEALAASLRIRVAYLEAIEAGRVADLPGNAYALGFLRTYATALGLDGGEMCRRFRAEVAEVNTKTELTFPAPVPERGVPVILLGVALAVGAYVGWYHLAERPPPVHATAPVPPELARLAEPTALAPKPVRTPAQPAAAPDLSGASGTQATVPAGAGANGAAASSGASSSGGQAGPAATLAATEPPAGQGPAGPGGTPAATTSGANSPAGGGGAAGGTESASTAPAGSTAPAASEAHSTSSGGGSPLAAVSALAPPAQAAPMARGGIVIRATAEAWIEVRDSTGAVIFTKLMQPGESWAVPRQPGLTLTTGNAGGTQLLVDGTVGAPLGVPGEVERNQPLDAGLIKAGALPAQIAAAAAPDGGGGHPGGRAAP